MDSAYVRRVPPQNEAAHDQVGTGDPMSSDTDQALWGLRVYLRCVHVAGIKQQNSALTVGSDIK